MGKKGFVSDDSKAMRKVSDKALSMSVDDIVREDDPEVRKEMKEKYFDSIMNERSQWEENDSRHHYRTGNLMGTLETCLGIIAGCEAIKIGTHLWNRFIRKK